MKTGRSRDLETNDRLDIHVGRKFLQRLVSMVVFLSVGKIRTRLCEASMQPSSKDRSKIYRKKGARSSIISTIIKGGRGSSSQDLS